MTIATQTCSAENWHTLSSQEVLNRLEVAENGLNDDEVKKRQAQYGLNQLTEAPRPGFLSLIWEQISDFVVMLLIVAAVISGIIGWSEYIKNGSIAEFIDAGAIVAIVLLNATLGIIQERRAEEALAALKKLAAPEAHILRNGKRITMPARELVPGDIVFLEAGNFIPADVRLLEAVNLRVEEASLTGESLPVQKNAAMQLNSEAPLGDRKNSAFMGTTVSYGRGRGVVTSTGMKTQLGLIAEMLQSVESEETPLQRKLDQLGKTLSIGAIILVVLVFAVALVNRTDISLLFSAPLNYFREFAKEITEVFMIAVSLAIAAVPEGLPAVVTISLALGMQEMIKRHALIRKLSSVETLGSATTICSDKTGTLTQNEMTVTRIWADRQFVEVTGGGYASHGEFLVQEKPIDIKRYPAILNALWVGAVNNDAEVHADGQKSQIIGDPTEAAMVVALQKTGVKHHEMTKAYPRENEIPFDSDRKRMVTVHSIEHPDPDDPSPFCDNTVKDWDVVTVKGAPDVVLKLCTQYQTQDNKTAPLTDEMRAQVLAANDAMTKTALRVIGVAYRLDKDVPETDLTPEMVEHELVFVGLIGMIDPARQEVKPALLKALAAGIRTVMITGDFPNTARAIAEEIGLLRPGHKVLAGAEIDALSDVELKKTVLDTDVFARVSPEHKMRIVDALQANNQVVAMTGDGVNDAPAIKRADIGVAMGITGTDVAKGAADMVLTDDNYASIVSAVEQGRIIYANIRKFVFFLLSSNVAEIMIIFLATLAGLPAPLTAIQLLWLNLVTDGAPALALAMEKGDPDTMQQRPRPKDEPIINKSMQLGIIIQTIAQTGAVLTAFMVGLFWHLEAGAAVPTGVNPILYILQHNWNGVDVQTAETMAFLTLSMAELFRAYTVRSERASLFQIGLFSNKWMQYAVGASLVLLIVVCIVPFLQPVFNTHNPSAAEWGVVLALAIFPAAAEEVTKFFLRRKQA
ncbi:MAG: cation-translocating P-type ATPase [Syntrophales bacterium]